MRTKKRHLLGTKAARLRNFGYLSRHTKSEKKYTHSFRKTCLNYFLVIYDYRKVQELIMLRLLCDKKANKTGNMAEIWGGI